MPAFLRITEPLRDLILNVEMQSVRGAAGRVMKVGAQAKEKIVGRFDPLAVGFAQPVPADEMRRGERAFLEKCHPKKVLVIAQAAAAALQVRLLHVDAVAKFRMPRGLVLHAQLHIFPFAAPHAVFSKLFAKAARQMRIAGQVTRFQHGGFGEHVRVRQADRFGNRTRGMADFESNIPEQIEDLFDHLRGIRRDAGAVLIVEEHHIHVAKGIEFPAAVTAERHHRQRSGGGAFVLLREARGRREDVAQHDVNQLDPERANFPAASSGLMNQTKPVFLDLQEFLVKRQSFRRPRRAR